MSIVRSARPHINYSVVNNQIIKDERLRARLAKNLDHIRRMEEGEL